MLASIKRCLRYSSISLVVGLAALSGCSQPSDVTPPKKISEPAAVALSKQVAASPTHYMQRDIRDDVFYFVLPDRFSNGDPDNDNGSPDIAASRGGFFPDNPRGFHGGDIQGITSKLDYLQGMGVSAIWMTPILRNRAIQPDGYAHHGYWILDFTQIDPHFGSNAALKELISEAHKRDIKIFFDIITNHTADVIKYKECHDDNGIHQTGLTECPYIPLDKVAEGDGYQPFIVAGEETLKSPAWLNDSRYYHNQGDSFWRGESAVNGDFVGLDDLKTSDPQVLSGMIDIYKNIISEFKPDGFRIDTVKHVDTAFWERFSPAIVAHAKAEGIPEFFIFGEVYSGDPVVLSRYTTVGRMPSVLDFGFQGAGTDVIYRQRDNTAIKQLFDNDDFYNDGDSQADLLMNFLGNHDMGRSGFFLQQARPDDTDAQMLERTLLAHALMYTSRGVPVIYYGDEQGFTGDGGDIAAREDMFASQVASYNDNLLIGTDATTADDNFDQTHPLYQGLQQLAALRQAHRALRYGIHQNRRFFASGVFAFSRVDLQEKQEYLAVFNPLDSQQNASFDATSGHYTTVVGQPSVVKDGVVSLSLPARSMTLLKADTPIPNAEVLAISVDNIFTKDTRIHINYAVEQAGYEQLRLRAVTTEIEDASGQFQLAAQDYTYPYRAILSEDSLSPGQRVRVTLSDLNGKQLSSTFEY